MKKLTSLEITLLNQLGDGACHSGKDLGLLLGVSRTAVWKHIKQLATMGLTINSLPQKGYQLNGPLTLLDSKVIQALLPKALVNNFVFHIYGSIDSTNLYLRKIPPTDSVEVWCAETQTEGRGRFGRKWVSLFGENIYCSSRWQFHNDLSCLSGLSLIVSLALIKTLTSFTSENLLIKWPNDILWNNKKLCGSLIEINGESHGGAEVIIGIGLNVNTNTQTITLADKPWCSLLEITQKHFDRNAIIAKLLTTLSDYLSRFSQEGLLTFMDEWKKYDYLYGKKITLSHISGKYTGIAQGINELGQLKLRDDQGVLHLLSSGDTSIREQ
jgi:BirA family biotin operon repressor/biotin-[acetyl-CoA-carboxylase] ligase